MCALQVTAQHESAGREEGWGDCSPFLDGGATKLSAHPGTRKKVTREQTHRIATEEPAQGDNIPVPQGSTSARGSQGPARGQMRRWPAGEGVGGLERRRV